MLAALPTGRGSSPNTKRAASNARMAENPGKSAEFEAIGGVGCKPCHDTNEIAATITVANANTNFRCGQPSSVWLQTFGARE